MRATTQPLDPACACYTCRTFRRAYLRHLAVAGEMLGAQLASLHNLHFYLDLMARGAGARSPPATSRPGRRRAPTRWTEGERA